MKNLTLRAFSGIAFLFLCCFHLQAQCFLIANAQVNISMPPSCTYSVPPSAILAPSYSCPGGSLVAEIQQGGLWVAANLNATHIGQTLNARVRDLVSGNQVLSTLKVEDKLAPVLGNCSNITVNCEDACTPISQPTVTDCSTVTLSTTTTVFSMPCSSSFSQLKSITYTATDLYGNSSSCNRTVSYQRRNLSTVVYPANVTIQVSGGNCTPWCANAAGQPNPTPANTGAGNFGSPNIDGSAIFPGVKTPGACTTPCVSDACQLTTTYTDALVTLCGTNRRVDRTWQVTAACGSPASQTYLQRIFIYTDGNTACGAACGVPFNLSQVYSSGTGMTSFSWSVPAGTCVVRYDIQYRVFTGGVWQPWVVASPGTPFYQASLPVGVPAQWQVRTRCFGVNSAYSPVKSFTTGTFSGPADDRDAAENAEPAADASWPLAPEMEAYPNPSNGFIAFAFREALPAATQMLISDLQGRILYQGNLMPGTLNLDFDLSAQAPGMYIAQLRNETGVLASTKFILTQ